jgi:hypothetical protein
MSIKKVFTTLVFASIPFLAVYALFASSPKVHIPECESVEGVSWFLSGALKNSSGTAIVLQKCAAEYDKLYPTWSLALFMSIYLLLQTLMFLRISPMLPNWFVNLVSPVAGVPLKTFALATALGLIPANILHYNTGKQLYTMIAGVEKTPVWQNMAILISLQFVALIPTLFKKQIKFE